MKFVKNVVKKKSLGKNKGYIMLSAMIAMATVVPLGVYATVKVMEGTYKAKESADISLNKSLTLTYAENLRKDFNRIKQVVDERVNGEGVVSISAIEQPANDYYGKEFNIEKKIKEANENILVYEYNFVSAGRDGKLNTDDDVKIPLGVYVSANNNANYGSGRPSVSIPDNYGLFNIEVEEVSISPKNPVLSPIYMHSPYNSILNIGTYSNNGHHLNSLIVQDIKANNEPKGPYITDRISAFYNLYKGVTWLTIPNKPIYTWEKNITFEDKPFSYAIPLGETVRFDFYSKGAFKFLVGANNEQFLDNKYFNIEIFKVESLDNNCRCERDSTVCSVTMNSTEKTCKFKVYIRTNNYVLPRHLYDSVFHRSYDYQHCMRNVSNIQYIPSNYNPEQLCNIYADCTSRANYIQHCADYVGCLMSYRGLNNQCIRPY